MRRAIACNCNNCQREFGRGIPNNHWMTRHALAALSCAAALAFASNAANGAASGVAVSPDRTSVEADTTQVFSARFLTASGQPAVGEAVQFSNDACGRFSNGSFVAGTLTDSNGVASMPFTAMQPGGTVCQVIAASGAQVRFQVFTYRLSQISITATAPATPVPGQSFQVPVDVRMGVFSLPNIDLGARVSAGSASISPSTVNTGAGGTVTFNVSPGGGDFDLAFSVRTLTKSVPIRYAPAVPVADPVHQDLWWSGSAENGWGLTIVEHRDVLFVLIYAYDANGLPTWYVIPSGSWDSAHATYSGAIYLPRGTPFHAYDASRLDMGPVLGNASISFADREHATLRYTISGVSGEKAITRLQFGPAASAPMTGRTDMWWGGVAQNGWGIAVIQQNASLFTMWYTYDASGAPRWYAMPSGAWTSSDTYEGRVYRTTGSPWLGRAYDASLFRPVDVGAYRLRFSGDAATFEYSVEGRTGSLALTRTPF